MRFRLSMLSLLVSVSVATMAQFGPADADAKYATDLLKPGTAVPDFKLKDVNGRTQRLSKLIKGSYTVIDFWASWCPDCRKDIPNVKRMYEKFAPMGVQFVGVSFDNETDKWKDAVDKYALTYPQVSDLKRMRDS